MNSTGQAWEQRPEEPTPWFQRFEAYRLAGPGRSVLAVYRQEREKAGKGGKVLSVPGAWDAAAAKYQWRDRVEAWDQHIIEKQRQAAEDYYRQQLERHKDNSLKLANTSLGLAVRTLQRLDERLKNLTAEEIPLKSIPTFLRAAAAVAEAALNAEAQALTVDHLLRELDHGSDNDAE